MRVLFLLLLALPLHAYDVQAVYTDYLSSIAVYSAQNLSVEETAWAQAFTSLSTLSDPKDKAEFIKTEMLPRSKKLAQGAKVVKDAFKTTEAAEGLGISLEILILCDILSTQMFKAFNNNDQAALTQAMSTVAEVTALEGQRAKTVEAFLKTLRKEMKKAKMPKSAIDGVK